MKLLVTGATGFIGKLVVKQALAEGHQVRASLRDLERTTEVRTAVNDPGLECVALDLMSDEGWNAAVAGMDAVIHAASPVPVTGTVDPDDVIRPAVEGTERVARAVATAGVPQLVVTSSIAAILSGPNRQSTRPFGPDDWTDPDAPGLGPYPISKTLAELAARRIACETKGMSIVTVNPALVVGAPLDHVWASSLVLIDRLLKGTDLALPRLSFPCVAAQDVAEAHLRALDMPDGTRVVASDKTLWMREMAEIIRDAVPGAKTSRVIAPDWLVRLVALFSPDVMRFASDLGSFKQVEADTLTAALGRLPTPAEQALADGARAIAAQQKDRAVASG